MILRFLRFGAWMLALGVALPVLSALTTRPCADLAATGDTYGQALVLSARADPLTGLGPQSRARTLASVELYKAGTVSRLVMTGDATGEPDASAAAMMADLAIAEGVPAAAVLREPRSRSTLENALYSKPLLDGGGTVVLVTSGYHLWRGTASLAWAGVPVAAMCRSTRFGDQPLGEQVFTLAMESVKWWGNAGRALIWSTGTALGAPPPEGFLS